MEKLRFIHIPKTGGTAIKKFISDYYQDYFSLEENNEDLKTFTIVRDPLDRFLSLYSYWKNGSEIVDASLPDYSVNDFIYFLKNNDCSLVADHTNYEFFKPQANYINEYKDTIILHYKKDLTDSFNSLLNYLNIPINDKKISNLNVTKNRLVTKRVHYFAKNLNNFIEKKYASDIKLHYEILNHPILFKHVI